MSNFQESGISFKFSSPQWAVVKYDEHLAHKKVSNALQPTKAVDFLGIHDNRQLFLVEVKNYRGHTHDAETQEVFQAKGDELYRYLQPIITQYFIDNKSEIWLLFLIAHSKR